MQIITNYWGIIIGIIIGICFIITHKQLAYKWAKKEAIHLMFVAESQAETLILKNGQAKLGYVVNMLYAFVPLMFKPILNKVVLTFIVQKIFDGVVKFANDHRIQEPTPVQNQAAIPIQNTPQTSTVDTTTV